MFFATKTLDGKLLWVTASFALTPHAEKAFRFVAPNVNMLFERIRSYDRCVVWEVFTGMFDNESRGESRAHIGTLHGINDGGLIRLDCENRLPRTDMFRYF